MTASDWFSAISCLLAGLAYWKSAEANTIAKKAIHLEQLRMDSEEAQKTPKIELSNLKAKFQISNRNAQIWVQADILNLGGKTTLKDITLNVEGVNLAVQNYLGNTRLPCSLDSQDTTHLHLYFDFKRSSSAKFEEVLPGNLILNHSSGLIKHPVSLNYKEPTKIILR